MDQAARELTTSLLLPGAIFLMGVIWLIRVPRMESIYGFRTTRALISEEAWRFVHRGVAKWWLLTGPLCAAVVFAVHRWTPLSGRPRDFICVGFGLAAAIVPAVRVDKLATAKFGKGGEKKDVH